MSNEHKDNSGPAFPVIYDHPECTSEHPGMSLRDWFAGQALKPLIAHADHVNEAAIHAGMVDDALVTEGDIAKTAYSYADAMLKAREQ